MVRYLLLLLLAAISVVHGKSLAENPCTRVGHLPIKDKPQEFIVCSANTDGSLDFHKSRCDDGEIFSKETERCVPADSSVLSQDEEKELETTTTSSEEPQKTEPTVDPETTEKSEETPETTEETQATKSTNAPVDPKTTEKTDASETTEKSEATKVPETTEQPETTEETPETTEETPETTEEPQTTVDPETTERSEAPETTEESEAPETTDENEATKVPETTETTEAIPEPKDECPTKGFYPLSGSCHQFMLCADLDGTKKSYVLTCPEGKNYNPEFNFCDAEYRCSEH